MGSTLKLRRSKMESVYVDQFLEFFRRFIEFCQLDNWPNDHTTHEQMERAFSTSQHIEKCRDKMTQNNIITEFMLILNKKMTAPSLLLKNCFSNPSRYILKKIVTSSANISQMEAGLCIFLDLFSEEKLEEYLSDIMLEAASKDTLLKKISTELSKTSQSEFKSQFFLCKLVCDDSSIQLVYKMLQDCEQDMVDMLLVCLCNKNPKYNAAIEVVAKGFIKVMSSQNLIFKEFWKLLFRTEEDKFIQMCLNYEEICKLIFNALIDLCKLSNEQTKMSCKHFYVDLTYSEISSNIQKICRNDNLKLLFIDIACQSELNISLWEKEIYSQS